MGIALTIVIVYPIFLSIFLIKYYKKLGHEWIKEKFEVLYEGLKYKEYPNIMFYFFYVLRRLLFAILAIFVDEIPIIQSFMMIQISLFLLIYLIYYKPFVRKMDWHLEIFNETTILINCYHLFLFTDYVENKKIQYSGGTSMIVITILNIIFNASIMFWQIGKKVKKITSILYAKYRERYPKKAMKESMVVYLSKPTTSNIANLSRTLTQFDGSFDITEQNNLYNFRLDQEKDLKDAKEKNLSKRKFPQIIIEEEKEEKKPKLMKNEELKVEDIDAYKYSTTNSTFAKQNSSKEEKKKSKNKKKGKKNFQAVIPSKNLLAVSQRNNSTGRERIQSHQVFRSNIDQNIMNMTYLKRPSEEIKVPPKPKIKDERRLSLEMNIGSFKN